MLMLVGIRSAIPDIDGEVTSAFFPNEAFTPLRFMDYMTALKVERRCDTGVSLLDFIEVLGFDLRTVTADGKQLDIPENATLEDFPSIYFNETGERVPKEFEQFIGLLQSNPEFLKSQGIELPGTFGIVGYNVDNWHVPLLKCDPVHCQAPNQNATAFCERHIVGVAGGSSAQQFIEWVEFEYPDAAKFNIFVEFDNAQAMDVYVEGREYGRSQPKLAMGIVFDTVSGDEWKYHLRPNSTNVNFPAAEERRGARTTPDTDRLLDEYARKDDSCSLEGAAGETDSCAIQYAANGVLTFQRLVHDFIGNRTGASELYPVGATDFVPFPSREYVSEGFLSRIGSKFLHCDRIPILPVNRFFFHHSVHHDCCFIGAHVSCGLHDQLHGQGKGIPSKGVAQDDECNGI
jgi:hypothetical protein